MNCLVCLSLILVLILSESVPISSREHEDHVIRNPLSRFEGQQDGHLKLQQRRHYTANKLRFDVKKRVSGVRGVGAAAGAKTSWAIPSKLPCIQLGFFLSLSLSLAVFLL